MTYLRSGGIARYMRQHAPVVHPDLAAHNALGLATQAELDAHAATSGHTHPDLGAHNTLGLATDAEVAAAIAAILPWHIDLVTTMSPIASSGAWSVFQNSALFHGGHRTASGLGNWFEWNVVLGAGTWTLEAMREKFSDSGKEEWSIDNGAGSYTTLGTIDDYSAVLAGNEVASLTGLVIASSIRRRLRLTIAAKNASSSAHVIRLQHVQLRRTA